jgi:hypothetical protein
MTLGAEEKTPGVALARSHPPGAARVSSGPRAVGPGGGRGGPGRDAATVPPARPHRSPRWPGGSACGLGVEEFPRETRSTASPIPFRRKGLRDWLLFRRSDATEPESEG